MSWIISLIVSAAKLRLTLMHKAYVNSIGMKSYYILSNGYNTEWKMITIQIGSNDQCAACGSGAASVTADAYGNYVEAAIQRIKAEIPKTVVNLRE